MAQAGNRLTASPAHTLVGTDTQWRLEARDSFFPVYYPEKTLACASFYFLSSKVYIEIGWFIQEIHFMGKLMYSISGRKYLQVNCGFFLILKDRQNRVNSDGLLYQVVGTNRYEDTELWHSNRG